MRRIVHLNHFIAIKGDALIALWSGRISEPQNRFPRLLKML
ncbi:hypothetical protein [Maricaulis sp.]|nr:hypothetical protein [Maricaulis sp.]